MVSAASGPTAMLSMLARQIEALREDLRGQREELQALRSEVQHVLRVYDERLRCVEREQARIGERASVLTIVGTAVATAIASLISYLRR